MLVELGGDLSLKFRAVIQITEGIRYIKAVSLKNHLFEEKYIILNIISIYSSNLWWMESCRCFNRRQGNIQETRRLTSSQAVALHTQRSTRAAKTDWKNAEAGEGAARRSVVFVRRGPSCASRQNRRTGRYPITRLTELYNKNIYINK